MLRVALTGGIATGKSYVRARIAARGVLTLDADAIVHRLFTGGSDVTAEVRRRFGTSVVRHDGAVDRQALGRIVFADASARRDLEAIGHVINFDPLEDIMSWEKFWVLLSSHKATLKALLMDQDFVAGIGNMYADEILFAAGLRYDRQSNSLSSQEVRRLYRSMVETLAEAVKRRGSSTAGDLNQDLFGVEGDYQDQHQAFDREGQACRRCRSTIVRVKSGGRSTFFCEHCQV